MREKDLKEDLATLAYKAEADHEVQMARSDLYKIAKYSIKPVSYTHLTLPTNREV